jgi:hypothetical protein
MPTTKLTYNLEGTTLNGRYYLEAVIGTGGFTARATRNSGSSRSR